MPPTDAEIPPPLPEDRNRDIRDTYLAAKAVLYSRSASGAYEVIQSLCRLLAEARRELAAAKEAVRGVLGKEPCPECDVTGCHRTEPNPCSYCVNGTRDVIDGLTLERAVERLTKRLQSTEIELDRVRDEAEKIIGERDHWKANHDEMVARNGLLRVRNDLPLDRTDAARQYENLVRDLRAERDAARAAVEELQADNERMEIMGREVTHKLEAARAAVETMRERAAKACEDKRTGYKFAQDNSWADNSIQMMTCELLAAAIRALPLEPDVKEPTP